MSALDDLINVSALFDIRALTDWCESARAELAALRAAKEQAERERDEARAQLELADRLATLTPRKCGTCAQEAARKMREACVSVATEQEEWAHNKYISAINDDEKSRRQIQQDMAATISFQLENLPLPSCDGCNPLKPEAAS